MIGKPEWFTYRTFGWGIAPKAWQGWAYVAVFVLVAGILSALPLDDVVHMWLFGIVIGVLVLDVLHIMMKLPKVHDERENYHQLLIERNVSFAAIVALLGVALFQSYQNRALVESSQLPFDWSIMVVLIVMVVVKGVSTLYLHYRK